MPVLRFLLDLGYPRKPTLDFILSRKPLEGDYSLCRNILYRCVHPSTLSQSIKEKLASRHPREKLAIDLLNVLSTVFAVENGFPVFQCTDGFIRDVLSSRMKIRNLKEELAGIIPRLLELVGNLGFDEVVFVIDKQIPWSGDIAVKLSSKYEGSGTVFRASRADTLLLELAEAGFVVASSDIVILERVRHVVDLPMLYMKYKGIEISEECMLDRLIGDWWTGFCREIDL